MKKINFDNLNELIEKSNSFFKDMSSEEVLRLKSQIVTFKMSSWDSQEKNRQQENKIADLKAKMNNKENKIADLENGNTILRKERGKLSRRLAEREEEISDLVEEINTCERPENGKLFTGSAVKDLSDKLDEKENKIADLEEENDKLKNHRWFNDHDYEKRISNLKEELGKRMKKIVKLEDKLHEPENEWFFLKKKITNLEEELKDTVYTRDIFEKELESKNIIGKEIEISFDSIGFCKIYDYKEHKKGDIVGIVNDYTIIKGDKK